MCCYITYINHKRYIHFSLTPDQPFSLFDQLHNQFERLASFDSPFLRGFYGSTRVSGYSMATPLEHESDVGSPRRHRMGRHRSPEVMTPSTSSSSTSDPCRETGGNQNTRLGQQTYGSRYARKEDQSSSDRDNIWETVTGNSQDHATFNCTSVHQITCPYCRRSFDPRSWVSYENKPF